MLPAQDESDQDEDEQQDAADLDEDADMQIQPEEEEAEQELAPEQRSVEEPEPEDAVQQVGSDAPNQINSHEFAGQFLRQSPQKQASV